jgi:hypothetical protein
MWMGGMPPLGYKAVNKKLEVEPEEAKIIQFIFERYGCLDGSLKTLVIISSNF